MRTFNTFGTCVPENHYMDRRENILASVMSMIDNEVYLIISRPRQYGKTTLVAQIDQKASGRYEVVCLTLDEFPMDAFKSENAFALAFCRSVVEMTKYGLAIPEITKEQMNQVVHRQHEMDMQELIICIRDWCRNSPKPVVLILDEVDFADGSLVFRDFLRKLRAEYLRRKTKKIPTFQSVILAGVSDVEHLKGGIRPQTEGSAAGSPWNIADNVAFPMELSMEGIRQMLEEYEEDHQTGMNVLLVAKAIMHWTSGYPYLVSRICQILDQENRSSLYTWTESGVDAAAVQVTKESNSLFSSLMEKIRNAPSLAEDLSDFIYQGKYLEYDPDHPWQKAMLLYGFIRVVDTHVEVANEIFRVRLTRYFDRLYKEKNVSMVERMREGLVSGKYVASDGTLDVYHILEDFVKMYEKVRADTKLDADEAEKKFLEEDGRRIFLAYITPIINGFGTYTIEEQTLDKKRMDVVIHYRGQRYVVELKIWRGMKYNMDGEKQLMKYLDYYGLSVGYMLSFNFNKNKKTGMTTRQIDQKVIHEAIV